MPHPANRKSHTRQKIIKAAARLFSAQGFEATSIEDVMRACGLTRGGFYAHFQGKGQLYQEALADKAQAAHASRHQASWLEDVFAACRVGLPAVGDARADWAFLATDVGSKIPEVRQSYLRALEAVRDGLRDRGDGTRPDDETVLAATAMTVGALSIAATVDDAGFMAALADACHEVVQVLCDSPRAATGDPAFFWSYDPIQMRPDPGTRSPA